MREEGLTDEEAVEVMVGALAAACRLLDRARPRGARRGPRNPLEDLYPRQSASPRLSRPTTGGRRCPW